MVQISEKYRTGLQEIDEEHVVLLDLTEQARKLFEDENMLFKSEDISRILTGLSDYTKKHFVHEEAFMESIGYDGLTQQRMEHREFEKKLDEFTDRVNRISIGTQDAMLLELFEYLNTWLHEHIKKEDMKYAVYATRKAQADH